MKNIFKLMGIALMAGLMFTACGEDEETIYEDGVTVSFAADNWNAASTQVRMADNNIVLMAYKEAGMYPQVLAMFKYTKEKTYKTDMKEEGTGDDAQLAGFDDERVQALKYYSKQYTTDNGAEADYWGKHVEITVNDKDLDAGTFNADITATMFDFTQWYDDYVALADCGTQSLKLHAQNISLAE